MSDSSQENSARRTIIGRIIEALQDRRGHLMTLAEAKEGQVCTGQEHRGFRIVPMSSVKGTIQRPYDFDRNFRPAQKHTRGRWESVNRAFEQGVELPPVRLYKYRDAYFVSDGHHRVSVGRYRGAEWVDAVVTEYFSSPEPEPAEMSE